MAWRGVGVALCGVALPWVWPGVAVELRKMEDAVPPRSTEVVLQAILERKGKQASESFSSFDETPLAGASLGQVNRAVPPAPSRSNS